MQDTLASAHYITHSVLLFENFDMGRGTKMKIHVSKVTSSKVYWDKLYRLYTSYSFINKIMSANLLVFH